MDSSLSDSRGPFHVLKETTDELKTLIDENVAEILTTLEDRLTALITEPASAQSPRGPRLTASMEFSKAKYDVFSTVTQMVTGFFEDWKERLEDSQKGFLESVELFLANMKLENKSGLKTFQARQSPLKAKQSANGQRSSISSLCSTAFSLAAKVAMPSPLKASPSTSPQKNKKNVVRFDDNNEDSEEESEEPIIIPIAQSVKKTPVPRRSSARSTPVAEAKPSPILKKTPVSKRYFNGEDIDIPGTSSQSYRTPSKRNNTKIVEEYEEELVEELSDPKDLSSDDIVLSVAMDLDDDEIYSPAPVMPKSNRRKTMLSKKTDDFSDINVTPVVSRSKSSKRKTIAADPTEYSDPPAAKRLKKAAKNASPINLLEGGGSEMGKYSHWISLKDIDGSVPPKPGVFELKVLQAKRPAYIGSCESLRQRLTLYKLEQKSGHKHLDNFITRNAGEMLVRYEECRTVQEAKAEEKSRVKTFAEMHKNPPAFN